MSNPRCTHGHDCAPVKGEDGYFQPVPTCPICFADRDSWPVRFIPGAAMSEIAQAQGTVRVETIQEGKVTKTEEVPNVVIPAPPEGLVVAQDVIRNPLAFIATEDPGITAAGLALDPPTGGGI